MLQVRLVLVGQYKLILNKLLLLTYLNVALVEWLSLLFLETMVLGLNLNRITEFSKNLLKGFVAALSGD